MSQYLKTENLILAAELRRLMPVKFQSDWGPQPIVCRWCECWLEYGDDSSERLEEEHDRNCFAVLHLGRPAKSTKEPRT